jgi:hypothetical protein
MLRYGSHFRLPPEHAQWERQYQEAIERHVKDQQKVGLGEPPLDVSFVRFVKPDERSTVYQECMARQGWAVAIEFDGGISYGDYPADQTPALLEADFRCWVQYPLNPRYAQPPTERQAHVVYDYFVRELVPCLEREGYDVDRTAIPTVETFMATFQQNGSWLPYDTVMKRQNDLAAANGGTVPKEWKHEWERINKACPQGPPIDRMYPLN